MLELRPTCEHCAKPLPPDSDEAMICTFECTFCSDCVGAVLANVCPNCGGGFAARPVRPATNWVGGNYLGNFAARTDAVHKRVDPDSHAALVLRQGGIDPGER